MKNFLSLIISGLFSLLVGGITTAAASFYGANFPSYTPYVIAGILFILDLKLSVASGILLSGFITNGSEFKGKEVEDIILRPFFSGQDIKAMGIKIIYTVKSSIKLTFFGTLSKIVKAYASGWQGGSTGAKKQKKLSLAEFKAEMSYSKQEYKDTIMENITNVGGIAQNDIDGTAVAEAEKRVFMAGVAYDIWRIFWLGDEDKKTVASGYSVDSTADVDYNVINGIWTSVMDEVGSGVDKIKRITLNNGTVAQVSTHTLTGTSGTANIAINGVNYLATFNTSLTQTAADFVTTHAAALLALGVVVTSNTADVILTSSVAGQPFLTVAADNATGDLAGTLAATTANTPAADLGTDEAKATFKAMVNGASRELKDFVAKKAVVIYATNSFIENYADTLEATGTSEAHKALVEGIDRYTYRGIPIIPMPIDTELTTDFVSPYPHRALLTLPENLGLVLNGANDFAEVRFWFNPDENENRQRAQFEFGMDFIHPELIVAAY